MRGFLSQKSGIHDFEPAPPEPVLLLGMSAYAINKLIDHLLRGRVYTAPSTLYVALFIGAVEVMGGGYARVAVPCSDSRWRSTQGLTTSVASSGTSGQSSNGLAVTFPLPTANWGDVTHVGVFDTATAGNLLLYNVVTVHHTVNLGDLPPMFGASDLTLTLA